MSSYLNKILAFVLLYRVQYRVLFYCNMSRVYTEMIWWWGGGGIMTMMMAIMMIMIMMAMMAMMIWKAFGENPSYYGYPSFFVWMADVHNRILDIDIWIIVMDINNFFMGSLNGLQYLNIDIHNWANPQCSYEYLQFWKIMDIHHHKGNALLAFHMKYNCYFYFSFYLALVLLFF